ncbi:peptide chain release factor N(5)-glutamine methyltransferase [Ulvibacter sp.]|nr:peptide chain release factor N(5)-glutamine methyltransferase [Ulvibacter sp.]
MTVKILKRQFEEALYGQYPSEEIQSFFSILSEKHLGMTRLELTLNSEMILSEAISEKYRTALKRLQTHEPIQYILGETEFYGLQFKVNRHTLIPRPETEELVDWICSEAKTQTPAPCAILDIGTGSGCIAVSLSKNIAGSSVSAIDVSEDALEVAESNASLNNVAIDFFKCDILKEEELPGQYDIIVSNPPYVRSIEKQSMQPNVLNFEPASALFVSDNNPLVFYKKIAGLAKTHLKTNGMLYFEINEYFSEDMVAMLNEFNFKDISVKTDFFGKDRMIKCTKNARA